MAKSSASEPVAIIGSACHFAGGVNSPSKLWDLLQNPRDVRSEIPDSRFSAKGFYHSNHAHHGHSNVMHSYIVSLANRHIIFLLSGVEKVAKEQQIEEDISAFDADFFSINLVETGAMDPQQRMLMETVYEAIEAAGMTIEGLKNSDTGVFVGAMSADYEAIQLRDIDAIPTYFATGTARSILSNRISYFFDWHGPCMTIDTACSSSLVAVDQAVKALRSGESRMAVACGSNLILGPESYIMESKLKMLSPDGLGRMWDKAANGYARGDGVATIVLKTLTAAIADGDHIDCVLRETGVNQDGATPGITMPSAAAQQALIESTYAKAGLDLNLKTDRPQLFEAHGTGTPAGDPIEAEAISQAFFGQDKQMQPENDHLYVGSIKTILGHTEGTAGIAAVLRASLAIQNSKIPPNLLFESLSPAVAPFYENLEIPKVTHAWPKNLEGPKRASVNSFGFGGTNAHAILESYEAAASVDSIMTSSSTSGPLFTPYVFSAASERSLKANLLAFATHLEEQPSYNAHNLAYTLRQRRSVFSHRIAYSSESLDGLRTKILSSLDDEDATVGVKARGTIDNGAPKILGIFTGQGAQYPRMGASLVEQSPLAAQIIDDLESHLSRLLDIDRPNWSLRSELLASSSRVHEAAISQPLCTAVQILLVDLLRLAHVEFDAVVGHSSGEIAAAYAAGYLTARDAIVIAYYRGLQCQYAASPNGSGKGAMLAVGTSLEDATELCKDDMFAGRIYVAAHNSSSSVTISGDEDAIDELQIILDDENKFNRRLKVDQAYHSSHMLPCFDPYVESLDRAKIKAQSPSSSAKCLWYSSVYNGSPIDPGIGPSNVYWAENMTKPVLFGQALAAALSGHGVLDIALEVGAHPALKGPCSQSMSDVLGQNIPYHGCLDRKTNAVQAMSTCLGFLWSCQDNSSVDLNAYEIAVSRREEAPFTLVKGLPSYQWNHSIKHWHESRRSRRMRLRKQPFHQLLGDESPDSAPHHLRWTNVLKPREIDWLEGHQVQGQIVFPAASYVCTALEAAKVLAAGKQVQLIELSDFVIHQAITFERDNSAVEVLIELSHVTEDHSGALRAKFTYSAALGAQTSDLQLAAGGEVRLLLGSSSPEILPERGLTTPHLIDVQPQRQYGFMESLGYNFTGAFCSLKRLRRKLNRASCELSVQPMDTNSESLLLLHPAEVDAAFQSVMLAYSYPGDDQLRTLHLPASISKIRVNPALCGARKFQGEDLNLSVDSTCNQIDRATPGSGFFGHVDFYVSGCANAALQVDGVKFVPFAGAVNEDRNVFHKMDWVLAAPDGISAANGIPVTQEDTVLLWVLSRIASFYLRDFDGMVPADSPVRVEAPLCHYLNYARHMTGLLRSGEHKYAKREWLADTFDDIMEDVRKHGFSENADVKIMFLVGETMPRVFKQETTMIEHMRTSGLLDAFYTHGIATMQSSLWLSHTVKQITDRHPHLNILEIGAGTGGATKNILNSAGQSFDSYTFTDISSSFFENAAEIFAAWRDRMVFKVYDAERDAIEQGFEEGKYDVVIASFIIHATAELSKTMRNLRSLLKPGGYLVVAEGTSDGPLQSGDGFIFGALPGWWLGVDEGRVLSPFVNVPQWDALLRCTGFSGIDTLAPAKLLDTFGIVLFVSQAVDDQISFLREPLATAMSLVASASTRTTIAKLVIVGGVTESVAKIARELGFMFKDLAKRVVLYKTLKDVDYAVVDEASTVISLTEIDMPVFKEMTSQAWHGLRNMFKTGKTLLWISTGRLADEPWSNMPVGFGRSATNELSELRIQFLDFPARDSINVRLIAESLLRLHFEDLNGDDFLWTAEPELVIDAEGRHLVPRLNPIAAANDRYNSIQRPILHEVDVGTSVVELHQTSNRCSLTEIYRYETAEDAELEMMKLRTTSTVLSALKTKVGHQFLASGVDSTGRRYLALVPRPLAVFDILKECAVSYDLGTLGLTEVDFLAVVAAHLLSLVVMKSLLPGQTIALHNVSPLISQAVNIQASLKGVIVFCTTDSGNDFPEPISCVRLPAYISRSELSQILPSELACFVGLSSKDRTENEDNILSTLSYHCRCETASSIYSIDGIDAGLASTGILTKLLKKAVQFAQDTNSPNLYRSSETVSLANLTTEERPRNPIAIVDWTASTLLPVQVSRLDLKPMFKGNKTYWLCGMSGALGISVCDWMINQGVKYLVITSRNPKVEQSWLKDHLRNDVNVKIMSCDVTDEKALRAVHKRIQQTMPPIVGALTGAMVLRDSSIPNMQYNHVMDVVRPKVLGSLHLDRIFHNVNLDFFILVSSISCVIGNVGQANYAAANMYMCSLAANRRKRGLNAVALNGGAIIGAGYITESDRVLDLTVERMSLVHLSEEDFHQMIAEAIENGHIDSPNGSEITTGLLSISPDSPNIPKWYSNPKFSRFVIHRTASNADKRQQTATASIQDHLKTCQTQCDLSLLVQQSFGDQLRKILQTSDRVSNEEIFSKRGPELGLDSLISVDIRSWFLKNFQANIPVLKIMGNDTMATLVQSVVEVIPAEMVPQMSPSAAEELNESPSSSTTSKSDTPPSFQTPSAPTTLAPIDWEAECTPPADFATIQLLPDSRPAIPPKVIVVTGATGFLGHHLLNLLLKKTSTERIHCLGVRKLTTRLQNKELPIDSRVKYHEGKLSDPLLGLSEQEVKSIFVQADVVIHNGADTSHVKNYKVLRSSNVGSTIALTRLCLPRHIPMHYISSAGIAMYYNGDAFPEVSIAGPGSLYPASDGSFGYGCSKWTNERFLEHVHKQYSLPVCIYRPSTIIREGVDATTSQAELDWVNALLRYIRKTKTAPKIEHNCGALDLIHVESCCADVLNHVVRGGPGKKLKYINQVGDVVIPMNAMHDMDADKGDRYELLPLSDWISRAVEAGLHPAIAMLIQAMDEPGRPDYPRLLKGREDV
ncbi:Polyketide synthase-nonribosomal peptide synthetase [Lachnellula occidentalis]|uniref:Polyketide synthase-nonribosomal peptide synthetase n=1 Tax=Lachnellula occidentalis TaxID=215460 RepID=A0A8H8S4X5_9HELO|nr:Polyketide synthase-nonribosomal peptide synthetase [Lachnellula occidentalis]